MIRHFSRRFRGNRRGIGGGVGARDPALLFPQSFGVECEVSVLEPLLFPQTFSVEAAVELGGDPLTELDPLTMALADGLTVRGYYFVDASGVTETGGLTDQLTDRHTSANHYTQTLTLRPAYSASDASLPSSLGGNRGSVTADGSNDRMTATYNPPAPGDVFIFGVFRPITHVAAERLFGGDGSNMRVSMGSTADTLLMANGSTSAECAYTPGTWYAIEAEFHAASHRLRIGAESSTSGAGVGTNNPTGIGLFANPAGTGPVNASVSTLLICEGTPSAGFLTWLRGTWVPWLSASVSV